MSYILDVLMDKVIPLQEALNAWLDKLPASLSSIGDFLQSPVELPFQLYPNYTPTGIMLFVVIIAITMVLISLSLSIGIMVPSRTMVSKWESKRADKKYDHMMRKKEQKAFKLYVKKKHETEEESLSENLAMLDTTAQNDVIIDNNPIDSDVYTEASSEENNCEDKTDTMTMNETENKDVKQESKKEKKAREKREKAEAKARAKQEKKELKERQKREKQEKKQGKSKPTAKLEGVEPVKAEKIATVAPVQKADPSSAFMPAQARHRKNAFENLDDYLKDVSDKPTEPITPTEPIQKTVTIDPTPAPEEKAPVLPADMQSFDVDTMDEEMKEPELQAPSKIIRTGPKNEDTPAEEKQSDIVSEPVNEPAQVEEFKKVEEITESEPQTEVKLEPAPEPQTEVKPEPALEPQTEVPATEAEPETVPEVKPEPVPMPEKVSKKTNKPAAEDEDLFDFFSGDDKTQEEFKAAGETSEQMVKSTPSYLDDDEIGNIEDMPSPEPEPEPEPVPEPEINKPVKKAETPAPASSPEEKNEDDSLGKKPLSEAKKNYYLNADYEPEPKSQPVIAPIKATSVKAAETTASAQETTIENKPISAPKTAKVPKAPKEDRVIVKPVDKNSILVRQDHFVIIKTENGYSFKLVNEKDIPIFNGMEYKSLASCTNGIQTFRKNVRTGDFTIETDRLGNCKFILTPLKTTLIKYIGESFTTEEQCQKNIDEVKKLAEIIPIFEIVEESGKFNFVLLNNLGDKIFISKDYKVQASCMSGAVTFKNNVQSGEFEVLKDEESGKYRFVLTAGNTSLNKYQGILTRSVNDCKKNIQDVKNSAKTAQVKIRKE